MAHLAQVLEQMQRHVRRFRPVDGTPPRQRNAGWIMGADGVPMPADEDPEFSQPSFAIDLISAETFLTRGAAQEPPPDAGPSIADYGLHGRSEPPAGLTIADFSTRGSRP